MTWLPVPGWEGYYEASSLGEVRSVDRTIPYRRGTRLLIGRTLRPSCNPKGYRIVVLARDGKRVAYPVHRIIAEAFLGPLPAGLQTCHNDGDKSNNAATNLRYDTPSANELDKVRHGQHANANKTHCPQGHAFTAANTYYRKGYGRKCRACHREQKRAYDARQRSAA